jgi:hypothetical protein
MATQHEARSTTNIEDIREWAERRDGHPAVVCKDGERTDLLRIDFGERAEGLERISWSEFEKLFRENNLKFLYQERTKGAGESRFFKFIARNGQ